MTALISKLKLQHSLSTSAWPNYGLDVLNITMHTEVVIHSMNAYVWCWSKICGSLDEIPSLTKVKVGVLRPVQQPGSYWDRSSELPLVGLEPTEVTAYD